ncbi:MAG: type II methionyl aminopeptidase [Hadesarchaea archaeon]|nr:type II methionyl aminopeptidase [Hadesarchaea archaeon]
MLSEKELEIYRRVGRIAAEVREEVRRMVKPGELLLNIAETAEELIRSKGAQPAFPCNVSVNAVAAHYSPPADDKSRIQEGDVVKVDIGAHIDGYIADTAFTVAVGGKNQEIAEAVEQVLEKAIGMVKPGVNVGEIGATIEEAAKVAGFRPIENLTGHELARWDLHAGITIPNVKEESEQTVKEGDVLALEPFITNGAGEVEDQPETYIFRFIGVRPVQRRMSLKVLQDISRLYRSLPFAERWLAKRMSRIRLQLTLRDLINAGAIRPYHVLKEREDGLVAQAEHTLIVTKDGCEVTTR